MKKDFVKIWTEALRSGNYQQTTGKLFDPVKNAYCCLGVLCKLYEQTTGIKLKQLYEANGGVLPTEVMRWAEMKTGYGLYEKDSLTRSLSDDNDGGYSFDNIADTIEHYWEIL